jgi:hypothetical protein
MIDRIRVQNVKCLRDVTADLAPFSSLPSGNHLIGRPGAPF